VEHFAEVFAATDVEAALAAGIFHRREVPIQAVKSYLLARGIEIRA
jgi:glutamine amidotransferase/cyclase